MQLWHDKSDRSNPGGGLSPGRAFLVVIAVMLAAIGIIWGANRSPNNTPTSSTSPQAPGETETSETDELTDVFQALRARIDAAYAEADPSLLEGVFAEESPSMRRVLKGVRRLQRIGAVLIREREVLELEVVSSTVDVAELTETLIVDGDILDNEGNEVGEDREPERQVVEWTLHRENGQWLIFDSVIVSSERVSG